MDTNQLNQKRMSVKLQRLLIFMAAVMLALTTFTACTDDEDDNGGSGKGNVYVDKQGGSTTRFETLPLAIKSIKTAGNYTVRVGGNQRIGAEDQMNIGSGSVSGINVTIKAESQTVEITINSEYNGHILFYLSGNNTLTFGKGITLKGRGQQFGDQAIWIYQGALVIDEGVTITGFGGVIESAIPAVIISNGSFTLNGGEIKDNYYTGALLENSDFIMNSGLISGNKMHGIDMNTGTFTLNNGTISKNEALGGNSWPMGRGGGIAIYNGKFIMNNGLITENAAIQGGGVDISFSEFTMNGGTISKNAAKGLGLLQGGGVYCQGGWNQSEHIFPHIGTFIMKGGTITENTANYGGGVFIDCGTIQSPCGGRLIMEGGSIIKNTARYGGGLYIEGISSMSGGMIDENTAEVFGGGVFVYDSTKSIFTKNGGGTITGEDRANGNRALEPLSYPGQKPGHAVMSGAGKKDNTVDPSHNLDSSKSGPAGGWD